MIQEKGSLDAVPSVRLFVSIFEEKETGILYLKRGEIQKVLYFNVGRFTWGFSNSPEDKLEEMLLSRKMISDHGLDELKKNPKFATAPGKILVENGLITFEQLIETTRNQLQQIFSSVLSWNEGDFRFVHDTPPNRLVLHQLEIPQFIFFGLAGKVDRDRLEREIGPFELELMKTTESEKLKRYPLTPEQNQVLESFGTGDCIDAVLTRFGPDSEKALRLIYFLFLLELLIRKETWNDDSRSLRHEQIRELSIIPPTPDEEPTVRMKKTGASPVEKPIFFREEPAQTSRLRFWMIAIFLVLAILGLVSVLTPPTPQRPAPPEKVLVAGQEAILNRPPGALTKPEAPSPSTPEVLTGRSESQKPGRSEATPVAGSAGANPLALFRSGDLAAAAEQWKRELKAEPGAYSVFLELDCLKESVMDAYSRISRKDDFLILPRRREGQTCFLVLWGKFPTPAAAAAAMNELPPYFLRQRDPPRVVALRSYI